ncbi:hypothetical protein TNCV_2030511 [Trichonephila clavipes]|nr:hypothetical protein TNCV_2030511 [Trichonephila clavipes]
MASGHSLPQVNLSVQGGTQGGSHSGAQRRKIGGIPELTTDTLTIADRRGNPTDLEVKVLCDNRRFDSRRRSGQSDHRFNNQGGRQGGSRNGTFRGQNGQDRVSTLRMTPTDLPYVPILLKKNIHHRPLGHGSGEIIYIRRGLPQILFTSTTSKD